MDSNVTDRKTRSRKGVGSPAEAAGTGSVGVSRPPAETTRTGLAASPGAVAPRLGTDLADYEIGAKLRALRLKKKIGLVELGRHTGLSPALLSKIETGRLIPTLPTLLRVALVFSVGLDYFFAGSREKPVAAVVRRSERMRLPDRPEPALPGYYFESLDFPATERRFNSYFAEFLASAPDDVRAHAHPGAELIYIIGGTLALQVGTDLHVLEAGDSMYFDSSVPHAYRRASAGACTAIVVTSG